MAQRVGRGLAVLFHDRGTRRAEWSAARPGHTLPPGKTRYPFYRRQNSGHRIIGIKQTRQFTFNVTVIRNGEGMCGA